jgi:hypothetical protein
MPTLLLTVIGNGRSLLENITDGKAILHLQRHEQARHEGKVEIHVALIPSAVILSRRQRAEGIGQRVSRVGAIDFASAGGNRMIELSPSLNWGSHLSVTLSCSKGKRT